MKISGLVLKAKKGVLATFEDYPGVELRAEALEHDLGSQRVDLVKSVLILPGHRGPYELRSERASVDIDERLFHFETIALQPREAIKALQAVRGSVRAGDPFHVKLYLSPKALGDSATSEADKRQKRLTAALQHLVAKCSGTSANQPF